MKRTLMKMLWAALPLAGVLMTAPPADAHWRHHHHHHCHPYYQGGSYDRGNHYGDEYRYRRGWYNDRRHRYEDDYYPSRYPYRRYEDSRYYGGGYPWRSVFVDR